MPGPSASRFKRSAAETLLTTLAVDNAMPWYFGANIVVKEHKKEDEIMLSHDGKELAPHERHQLQVYQRSISIPPDWNGHTLSDTLFVKCDDCSDVKPLFQFYQNPNCQMGVYTVCIDCCLIRRRENSQAECATSDDSVSSTMKRCAGCEQTKPITEFYRDINGKDGHQRLCRSCAAALNNDYITRLLDHPDREEKVIAHRRKQTVRVCIEHGLPIPAEDDNADVKQCSRCQCVRSLDEFYANHRALDQKGSRCIQCNKGRQQGTPEEVAHVRQQQTLKVLAKHGLSHPGHDVKECSQCGFIHPLEAFSNNRKNLDGKEYYCRGCRSVFQKQARQAKKEKGQ